LTNPSGIVYFGEKNPGVGLMSYLEGSLKRRIEEQRLYQSGIDPEVIAAYRTKVNIQTINIGSGGEEKISDATVNYVIGFLSGILIYIFIFVYGNQIMQGVIEEKSSRIVEILISSLRPFQLMMGKIVGIGAVGLTQFLIWIVLIGAISSLVMGYFGLQMPQQQALELANPEFAQVMEENSGLVHIMEVVKGIDFIQLVLLFIFYFLGGYLLYGAFFAAIGAAIDTPSEAQQFVMPITIPLIIGYMGLFVFILNDPDSQVSFWLSIIPLTSPIAMVGRASYGVPTFDLVLSMCLLVLGFLGSTWMAGKIYRIGILVHGSKINYKTLWRWLKTK